MASILKHPNGRRSIQFLDRDGKRHTIGLSKTSDRNAQAVRLRIEALVSASLSDGLPDDETARWVANLADKLADRLARAGLIPERARETLGAFLDAYSIARADVKGSTRTVYSHAVRNLKAYFGEDRDLRSISEGDALEWSRWLTTHEKLGFQTVRRRCGLAKQFFGHAVKKRLLDRNPFIELKAATGGNPAKYRFITRETTQAIIDACPDAQWRAIVALARYGGLRCPSEILTLTWDRIDWERDRINVYSPKTERYPGGANREIPLFLELRPYLDALWERAKPGEPRVITRYEYHGQQTNLRTQFDRIVRQAGFEPWPKAWQNLRSSRETELAETWPLHVVTAWIGNSEPVARKHYLQVTAEHFERAVRAAPGAAPEAESAAKSAADTARQEKTEETQNPTDSKVTASGVFSRLLLSTPQVGPAGLEPATGRL